MTYECILKKGHSGAGSYNEQKVYIRASNIIHAMKIAKKRGGVKKGRSNAGGQSVLSVKEVKH